MSSERLDRIRPAFESYVTDGKLSGVVTVVARGGEVVHVEASGHQDVEAGEPMTEDTIFRMYSMTKPIASAAIMILWEEGHFLLSTPLSAILPEFADTQVYVSGGGDEMETEPPRRPIVVRDLMTHTSGLTYTFIPSPVAASYAANGLEGSADSVPHDDLAHYVRELAKQPLLAHPGTAWNYSVGLEVAGRVVEVVFRPDLSGVPEGTHLRPAGHGRHGLPRPGRQSSTASPSTTRRRRRAAWSSWTIPRPAPIASRPRSRWAVRAWSPPPATTCGSPRCWPMAASSTAFGFSARRQWL